jgi:hypothetical protein
MDPKYEKAKRIVCKFDYETVDKDELRIKNQK